ncbi:MAG: hypothetical protein ABWW70_05725 [Thermoproteota archaeon]
MTSGRRLQRWTVYLIISVLLMILAVQFILWSIGYMERGYVATSLLAALSGFTLLSGGIYALKISAYVYSQEASRTAGEGSQ